jgi:hypothetical protein
MHLMHRICENCGKYRGRLIADLPAQRAARQERRVAKLRRMGEEVNPQKDEASEEKGPKALDLKKLSQKDK